MSITALCVLAKPWEAECPSAGTVQVICGAHLARLPTWAACTWPALLDTLPAHPVVPPSWRFPKAASANWVVSGTHHTAAFSPSGNPEFLRDSVLVPLTSSPVLLMAFFSPLPF